MEKLRNDGPISLILAKSFGISGFTGFRLQETNMPNQFSYSQVGFAQFNTTLSKQSVQTTCLCSQKAFD